MATRVSDLASLRVQNGQAGPPATELSRESRSLLNITRQTVWADVHSTTMLRACVLAACVCFARESAAAQDLGARPSSRGETTGSRMPKTYRPSHRVGGSGGGVESDDILPLHSPWRLETSGNAVPDGDDWRVPCTPAPAHTPAQHAHWHVHARHHSHSTAARHSRAQGGRHTQCRPCGSRPSLPPGMLLGVRSGHQPQDTRRLLIHAPNDLISMLRSYVSLAAGGCFATASGGSTPSSRSTGTCRARRSRTTRPAHPPQVRSVAPQRSAPIPDFSLGKGRVPFCGGAAA